MATKAHAYLMKEARAAGATRRTCFLGDLLEAAPFSQHKRDTIRELAHGTYADELREAVALLEEVEASTDEIDFLEGNHEAHVERWLARNGAPLHCLADEIKPRVRLSEGRAVPFRWHGYASDGERVQALELAPGLVACHGWSHGINAARNHLRAGKGWSIAYGHTHRIGAATSRDPITGRLIRAYGFGCLSRLHPLWKHGSPTDWAHGFGLLVEHGETWEVYQVRIDRGRAVLPDGTMIEAGTVGAPLEAVGL